MANKKKEKNPDKKKEKSSRIKKEDDDKLFAFLGVLLSIIGFLIVYILKKDSKYAMFYAKQSLVIFIMWVIISVFTIMPLIGQIIGPVLMIGLVILWIISLVYSLSGKMKDVWLVSDFAKKIDL
jgi:uncharacterized membrane protein